MTEDVIEELVNKNQYNYSIIKIIINYTKRTVTVQKGGRCSYGGKKASKKTINRKILEFKTAGFEIMEE